MNFLKLLVALLFVICLLLTLAGFGLIRPHSITKPSLISHSACPVIDVSKEVITHPACNQNNGSITGITITSAGTKKSYIWRDAENDIVGNSLDLENIPSGTYMLEFSDNSGCALVFSSKIFVQNANAVTIDDSGEIVKDETCNDNGSITGIIVNGATTIEWHNVATGAIVSTSSASADLAAIQAGTYQLYAYNATCQLTGKPVKVSHGLQIPTVIDTLIQNPQCGGQGSVTITLNVQPGQPKLTFFLVDAYGNQPYSGLILGDKPNPVISFPRLDGGVYNLFVRDDNNCTVVLLSFTIKEAGIEILYDKSKVVNDRCNQHLGEVVPVIYGLTPNSKTMHAQFTWTNVNTKQVVGSASTLVKVGAGTYEVKVIDPQQCETTGIFTVLNVSPSVVPPKATGTTLCLPGTINITVTNADTVGTFKLYASATDSIPLAANSRGIFYRHVDQTTDFYLSRVHGDCESERTKVTETVVADIKIPNAFTPNNDGYNDYWNLSGIEKFPGAEISVFTRGGQLVFHSINYPKSFDGTINGSPLQAGVYYYVIDVKQPICFGKISGSVTIIK